MYLTGVGAMYRLLLGVLLLSFICSFPSPSYAFRCGHNLNRIATVGMHKYKVLKDCGTPASKEIIGIDSRGRLSRIVEQWLYVINAYGNRQLYLIKFDRHDIAQEIVWMGN